MRLRLEGRGKIYFPSDFKMLGGADAVKMALSRLAEEKMIVRLAQGIYLYPKIDPELGILMPSIETIATALAKRDRARIIPSGVQAMQMLGLTTQVPLKVTYLTDGSPRRLKMGTRTITFKRVSPRQLAMKGKITTLVAQALQALGKENVTSETKALVHNALKQENPKFLQHDIALAPEWIAKIMRGIVENN
jgi:hypothetical protein